MGGLFGGKKSSSSGGGRSLPGDLPTEIELAKASLDFRRIFENASGGVWLLAEGPQSAPIEVNDDRYILRDERWRDTLVNLGRVTMISSSHLGRLLASLVDRAVDGRQAREAVLGISREGSLALLYHVLDAVALHHGFEVGLLATRLVDPGHLTLTASSKEEEEILRRHWSPGPETVRHLQDFYEERTTRCFHIAGAPPGEESSRIGGLRMALAFEASAYRVVVNRALDDRGEPTGEDLVALQPSLRAAVWSEMTRGKL